MEIEISNKLKLTRTPKDVFPEICSKLTFQNPKWLENERMGRWQGGTPKLIRCYKYKGGALYLPRGFIRNLIFTCRSFGEKYKIIDHTRCLPEIDFHFGAQPKPFQTQAIRNMLQYRQGTLSAATGAGKTVMALAIIAERRQPTLITVHTKELLEQWIDRIEAFLGIDRAEIGIIGGGKHTIGQGITVALVQSLYKCADEVAPHIGHLVVDECHRAPSRTFTEAVTAFDCKYLLGLTATPWRRDKLSKLIFWYLGDVTHEVDKAHLIEEGHILDAEVITRETDFIPCSDPSTEYSAMLRELTADSRRNALIASDVAQQAKEGQGISLVLSDRKAHCEALRAILARDFNLDADVLTGDQPEAKRREIIKKINDGRTRIVIAIGALCGEGLDAKNLSNLFLATPIRFSGRLLQYVGRVLRPAPGKPKPKVFDYIDINVGPLIAAAKARQRVYVNQMSTCS